MLIASTGSSNPVMREREREILQGGGLKLTKPLKLRKASRGKIKVRETVASQIHNSQGV